MTLTSKIRSIETTISTAWLQCKHTFDFCDLKSLFTFWLSSSLFRNPFNLTNFLTRYLKILIFGGFWVLFLLSYNVNKLSRFSWLWFCNNWQQKSWMFVYIFLQRPSDNFWTGISNLKSFIWSKVHNLDIKSQTLQLVIAVSNLLLTVQHHAILYTLPLDYDIGSRPILSYPLTIRNRVSKHDW